ncbi:MAG TPA: acyl-CoA dehydrogenase family protein [Myxococcota bacterium]|nr:acyl-CoA dehydrogenase family protein [Myxococcota bacterium]
MDYDLSATESELVEKIKMLVADKNLPEPETLEKAGPGQIAPVLRAWLARLGDAGYLAEQAGPGRLAAQTELARRSSWIALAADIGARLLCDLISRHGSPEQKMFIDPILQGKSIAAVAASEPLSGSVPKTLETQARKDGPGFLLSGSKSTVSLAPMADVIGVLGRIGERTALFLIDGTQAGVEFGERLDTLGYKELCTCPLELRDVRLEPERVVGPFDPSEVDLLQELRASWDRALTGVACGTMRLCLDQARASADVKRTHAKPPAGYQSVRFALAEMLTLSQTAELLALRAAWAAATGDRGAASLALCAKVFATENAGKLADKALQIMAAAGYSQPNPVERAFRNAHLGTIMGNTSQVARMDIADDVLQKVGEA